MMMRVLRVPSTGLANQCAGRSSRQCPQQIQRAADLAHQGEI